MRTLLLLSSIFFMLHSAVAQQTNSAKLQHQADSVHNLIIGSWKGPANNEMIYITQDSIIHYERKEGTYVATRYPYFIILSPQFSGNNIKGYNLTLCNFNSSCGGNGPFPYLAIYSVNDKLLRLGKKGKLKLKKVILGCPRYL